MNKKKSILVQSWDNIQIQGLNFLRRDRLSDQLSGHCLADVCGGA
jgi:hypothetical protein